MTSRTRINLGAGKNQTSDVVQQALDLSADWHHQYTERHTYEFKRLTHDAVSKLAIARYEWLLTTARDKILLNFDDDELLEVAISLQRELAVPNDYPVARAVADDNEILWKDYKRSKYCTLIEKLLALTPLEEMALRDIIEPFSYRWQPLHERFADYIKKERAILSQPMRSFKHEESQAT